ncbi:unnamed protein product, partial [marine sediment metagenome]
MDEVWGTKEEAFQMVDDRVRDKRMPNQKLLTTTLDDPTSWMHQIFVEKYDPKFMEIIYANSYSNIANLPTGYIERKKQLLSSKLFQRMIMAKWVSLEGENIYYNFDRNTHVLDIAEFDPNLQVHWWHDFNIGEGKPMSSCCCQIGRYEINGKRERALIVFDEIILSSADTNDAILEYEAKPWWNSKLKGSNTIISGDSSGRARDTRSKKTDYSILRTAGYHKQNVPGANPPIRTRHNTVNAILKNHRGFSRVFIHPRCKTLI